MAASVLNSPRAVEVSVYVVQAFVRLRELVGSHRELARRLEDLERKIQALALQQDEDKRDTGAQLRQVFGALRALMAPPDVPDRPDPPRRPIGFVTPPEPAKKERAPDKR